MEKPTIEKQWNSPSTYRYLYLIRKSELLGALAINMQRLSESEAGTDPATILYEEFIWVKNRQLYGKIRQVEEVIDSLALGVHASCARSAAPILP